MKKINDYKQFENILPYASELYGVYQPLIGWKSKRIKDRIYKGFAKDKSFLITRFAGFYKGIADIEFNADYMAQIRRLAPGVPAGEKLLPQSSRILLVIQEKLRETDIPREEQWNELINYDFLNNILTEVVFPFYKEKAFQQIVATISSMTIQHGETEEQFNQRRQQAALQIENSVKASLKDESAIAGTLLGLFEKKRYDAIEQIFYFGNTETLKQQLQNAFDLLGNNDFTDPYLTFDPKKDIKDVSLSPLGVVHLFREYFFEFDTFLGSPVGHVWLSPGSTVELIEVSTRKTIVEKTFETSFETITKSERSTTDQDEISEAVKQDNRDDLKLGITSTVNQSWGTGSATATASLNMDRTQQVARENTHKHMRQQTEKLSTEIRENYKSTLKTVTETTDTSSKRYLLINTTPALINYELRRKMRQVGVQVQDIGSYLCWETFVDEPGKNLGLANLVHIAQPADLLPLPNPKGIDYPPDRPTTFTTSVVWDFGDEEKFNDPIGFLHLTTFQVPPPPESGYEVKLVNPEGWVEIFLVSLSGEDAAGQRYAFKGKFSADRSQILIGVDTGNHGIEWDERIDFVVSGSITYTPSAAKRKEIDDANTARLKTIENIDRENARKQQEAFVKAAKERIKLASKIKARKFEEMREEERTIVYRKLIKSLMSDQLYNLPDIPGNFETRHVLSELINSIFDIDKMLYFVAPEWWKPRKHYSQFVGGSTLSNDLLVNWSDQEYREDNYYITEDSDPVRMGSSLGWLLQLDGDNLRNAFLNAPWVKAVIPIRPGKEQAAINWLQNVNVEGADGLDAAYAASPAELEEIRTKLLEHDPLDQVQNHDQVTLSDAIRYLCLLVAQKHEESNKVDKYPKNVEIHDDNKVSATPIEKVYEHGFYPLKDGFRVNPQDPDPNNPDKNFQIFDQWVEVLPTDQIVPVEVKYDPITGRQVIP